MPQNTFYTIAPVARNQRDFQWLPHLDENVEVDDSTQIVLKVTETDKPDGSVQVVVVAAKISVITHNISFYDAVRVFLGSLDALMQIETRTQF